MTDEKKLDDLPNELLELIGEYASIASVLNLSMANRTIQEGMDFPMALQFSEACRGYLENDPVVIRVRKQILRYEEIGGESQQYFHSFRNKLVKQLESMDKNLLENARQMMQFCDAAHQMLMQRQRVKEAAYVKDFGKIFSILR